MPKPNAPPSNYSLGGCLFSLIRISLSVFILAILGFLGFDLWYRTTLKSKTVEENLRDQWTEIGEIFFGQPVTITEDGTVLRDGKVVPLKEVDNACLGSNSVAAPPPEAWSSSGQGTLLKPQTGYGITSLVITTDGKTLISGGKQLEAWDLTTRKLIRTFKSHTGFIYAVALSPDGQTLASGDDQGRIILWNWQTGLTQKTLEANQGIFQLVFASQGRTLLSGSLLDKTITHWQVQTGRVINTTVSRIPVQKMVISPDEQFLAVATQSANSVHIFRLLTGELADILIAGGQVESIAFTPDGKILASASTGEQDIRLWNMSEGQSFRKLPIKVLQGHQGQPYAISFSPDAKTLFATADGAEGKDHAVTVWNACTGRLIHRFGSQIQGASIALSADGKTLVTGGRKGDIQMWRLP